MSLTAEQIEKLRNQFTTDLSALHTQLSLLKPELRAAFNAVDVWVDDNTISFNNAFPEPSKSNLTIKQKLRILELVIKEKING